MDCRDAQLDLSAYLDAELSAERAAELRAHLEGCGECARLLAELRAVTALVGRLPERRAPQGLAEEVRRRLEGRAREAPPARPAAAEVRLTGWRDRAAARPSAFWPHALAMAATVVLAVGIGILVYLDAIRPQGPAPLGHGPAHERAATGPAAPEPAAPVSLAKREAVAPPESVLKDLALGRSAGLRASSGTVEEMRRAPDVHLTLAQPAPAGTPTALEPAAPAPPTPPALALGNEVLPRGGKADLEPVSEFDKVAARGDLRLDEAGANDVLALKMKSGQSAALTPDGDRSKAEVPPATAGEYAFEVVPPAQTRAAADGGQTFGAAGGQTVAVLTQGALDVQQIMNSVANGRAPAEKLREVATTGNLARAENQLIIQAGAREAAEARLRGLFEASRWSPLAATEAPGAAAAPAVRRDKKNAAEFALRDDSGAKPAAAPPGRGPAGYYWLAHRDGEDTWIVITHRDELSRFASRLAEAADLVVAYGSSEPLVAIRRLQERLEAYDASLRQAPAQAVRGDAGPGPAARQRKADAPAEDDRALGDAKLGASAEAPTVQTATARAGRDEKDHRAAAKDGVEFEDGGKKGAAPADSPPAGPTPADRPGPVEAGFLSWSSGTLQTIAPLPEGQVLLVIRVRAPETAPAEAESAVRAAEEAAPAKQAAPAGR